ncbi:hypothetical protein J5N97_021455 [Dioscorea zingiberensis]|uniref:WAT1-related protein n=1 Tax=Dioscorea zingiberensis TaxID=325984 RepID=A0A9D5CHW1_9LILI|nr:hypothetical protein J5N97_021455 [Dioscorea zingiberensis]
MGIKSLTLQLIPWCFHLAGAPCKDNNNHHRSAGAIRVIGSDCRIRIYDRSVSVAELMQENPLHLVCRSDSFFIGQRVPTLSPAEHLQPGHSYLLLPATFFHSNLSFANLASSLVAPLRPFDIRKTDSGSLQVRVSDEFLERMAREEKKEMRVCTSEDLEKDYRQLVRCKSKRWKPKLETIRESSTEKMRAGVKVFRGLFIAFSFCLSLLLPMDAYKPCIPYLSMILARILFAGVTLFTKAAVAGGMNPFVFVFYKQVFAALPLAPFAFIFERNKSLPPLPLLRIFCISFLGITMSSFMFTYSLRYISASFASATTNAIPAITLILALMLRIEKISKRQKLYGAAKLFGTLLCLAGTFMFVFYKGPAVKFINHHQIEHAATSHPERVISTADWVKGSLLMIASHTAWSIWIISQGPLVRAYPAELRLTVLQCFCTIIQTALITVIFERKPSSWKLGWNMGLLATFYSGAASSICFWLITWCVERKGAVFTAAFTPLVYLATIIYSIVFWKEILHLGSIGGAVLLVLGLYCVLWGKSKEGTSSLSLEKEDQEDQEDQEANDSEKDHIFMAVQGLRMRDVELVAWAVLPQFYAADVRADAWKAYERRRVVVMANLTAMVEPFVREYLGRIRR